MSIAQPKNTVLGKGFRMRVNKVHTHSHTQSCHAILAAD